MVDIKCLSSRLKEINDFKRHKGNGKVRGKAVVVVVVVVVGVVIVLVGVVIVLVGVVDIVVRRMLFIVYFARSP